MDSHVEIREEILETSGFRVRKKELLMNNIVCLMRVAYGHHSLVGLERDWYRVGRARIPVWSDLVPLYPMSGPDSC
jgi:hypothetical protein